MVVAALLKWVSPAQALDRPDGGLAEADLRAKAAGIATRISQPLLSKLFHD
jgi:hypothetical protein